ncbi:MAG: MarR family transcriptional regulator [Chloroflexi bacterium]|nr:MarR family transcriptional regulator [Chloroflexota bacterium]
MSASEPLLDTLSRVLGRVVHLWLHASRRFARERGLSVGQLMVLRQLQFNGPCTVSDIAQRMGVTNAAASQLLDRLVEQGLVVRRENPADRRSKSVVLTPAGLQVLEAATRWHERWVNDLLARFSPAEAETVRQALHILDAHLATSWPEV